MSAIDLAAFRAEAELLDVTDPAPMADRFEFPPARVIGSPFATRAYFAGNSLGLMPKATRSALDHVVESWSVNAVEGHFAGDRPWTAQAEVLVAPLARIVGAHGREVIAANTLTVNVHLLLLAFYRPHGTRTVLLTEEGPFPSDGYAAASHARMHGLDPTTAVVKLTPDAAGLFSTDETIATIERLGDSLSCILLPGIAFRTGQFLDIPRITKAAHGVGANVVWDLAHAAGNVPLSLHDWEVDAAAWCTYKYMNAGPGAVGAMFVHERHVDRSDLVRWDGWWGNAPDTRFAMTADIDRGAGALGWQMSNPPILAMVPIESSLAIFDEAGGMSILRERSLRLTGFLERLFDAVGANHQMSILTPTDTAQRGAQLSILVNDAKSVTEQLIDRHDVLPDERPPNIIRFAPTPLYTSYQECWRAGAALVAVLAQR